MQYRLGYSASVRHTCSSREETREYPWSISTLPVRIFSVCADDHHYPCGCAIPVREINSIFHSNKVRNILTFTGTNDTRSWVLMIYLTVNDDLPHGSWWYSSGVLLFFITGTAYPHGYWWSSSWVLSIVMIEDSLYRVLSQMKFKRRLSIFLLELSHHRTNHHRSS